MKAFYKKVKIVSFFSALVFILQSCNAYEKVPMSLDEAVTANKKVKVVTADNKKYKFQKIQISDGSYYGLSEVRNQIVKVPIQEGAIQSILPVDKPASSDVSSGTAKIAIVVLYMMGLTSTR